MDGGGEGHSRHRDGKARQSAQKRVAAGIGRSRRAYRNGEAFEFYPKYSEKPLEEFGLGRVRIRFLFKKLKECFRLVKISSPDRVYINCK